ncbi:MAG: D-sedoheptulose 7-phosphate isomerase [Candidatus Sumerlaeaceae bacterium]|nr:D-sedoheptulose 7-phosphate isomerase [Candidatus Sumerlaeaceae bacterium]
MGRVKIALRHEWVSAQLWLIMSEPWNWSEFEQHVAQVLRESAETKLRTAQMIAREIARGGELVAEAYARGRKVLAFGNGGSAADAQHFVAELVGRYRQNRPALAALALTTNPSAVTCIANDFGYDELFARQVEAFAEPGDVAVAISTSGKSPSVLKGLEKARELGCVTLGLAGGEGGLMRELCDLCIVVPSHATARIQEVHIAVLHIWCDAIEARLFNL